MWVLGYVHHRLKRGQPRHKFSCWVSQSIIILAIITSIFLIIFVLLLTHIINYRNKMLMQWWIFLLLITMTIWIFNQAKSEIFQTVFNFLIFVLHASINVKHFKNLTMLSAAMSKSANSLGHPVGFQYLFTY